MPIKKLSRLKVEKPPQNMSISLAYHLYDIVYNTCRTLFSRQLHPLKIYLDALTGVQNKFQANNKL